MNKEELYLAEDNLAAEIEEISEFVFNHAELGSEEFKSCKYLVEKLKEHGFTVTCPYLDLDTAFRAELYCGEGPKVAVLPEYDALPGYGPNKDEVAHACGHNWIAASTLGAALTLAKFKDQINGTIVVIGAPAEETTGGKCDIANRGGYDDIDAALQFHLGAENNMNIMTLAMDSIEFRFQGTASHAAAYPEKGVNALDAVNLMFAGINAMRQQTRNDARVAGIITSGGAACNIIPDYAACQFYIRAKDRAYLEELTQKVINCAKGAELMTGAKLEYFNFENSYDDLVYHDGLRALMHKNLNDLGVTDFVDSDEEASESSDIGNVSHVCPTVYCELDTGARPKVFAHHETFLKYVHGKKWHAIHFIPPQKHWQLPRWTYSKIRTYFFFSISLKLFHRLLMYLHMQLSYSADKLCQIPEQWLSRNRKYHEQHNTFCGHSGNREQLRQENGTA